MLVKEIYPNLHLFTFPNQFELCSTFFRLQEFYESPIEKIRNKYFTIEEFMNAHAYDTNKKDPCFNYFGDWAGFNVPGHIVCEFEKKFYNHFTNKEYSLLTELGNIFDNNFYIIGCEKNDKETIKHEIAHGLYYLNKNYKKEMNDLLSKIPRKLKTKIDKKLKEFHYCKRVMKDEMHAYLSTGLYKGMITNSDYNAHRKYICQFKKAFNKYFKDIKL